MTRALVPVGFLLAVIAFPTIAIFSSAAHAQPDALTGRWQQTASNAGDCPTCTIDIQPYGVTPGVFNVIANNGWTAQVKISRPDAVPGEGQDSALVAEGMGRWSEALVDNPGGIFSLTLTMSVGQLMLRMGYAYQAPIEGRFSRASGDPALAAADFPAGSWGGIVRAGPGMEFARLTSLPEGEPIFVLENSGVVMGGYPWFKIRYRDNKTGYQWGGIICALGTPRPGIFEICPGKAGAAAAGGVVGPVDFACDEGIPLRVTFDNRGATPIATVTHDSLLTVHLPEIASGSGARYSDGHYTLHSKDNTAIFSWGAGEHYCTRD